VLYALMKSLHILTVALFLGNVITGVFWKEHADRTRDPKIMAHVMSGIIASDRIFTIPSVILITVFGFVAAILGGYPILGTSWIWQSIVLFTISGIVFSVKLAPLQRKLRDTAAAGAQGGAFDEATYRRLSRSWGLWGAVATLAPLAALFLMVMKPVH
jgi:uncharacterized membrane protein